MFGQLEVSDSHVHNSTNVKASWDFSCALSLNNEVGCWGLNLLGQTDIPEELVSTDLSGDTGGNEKTVGPIWYVKEMSVGLSHTCMI
mmetsp:Transcript_46291/g.39011  ORF Transcript_46291/g.39011 Transcript_46291/m.39011 type:complete len:87 (+) Transcript_46291:1024-1284(+)